VKPVKFFLFQLYFYFISVFPQVLGRTAAVDAHGRVGFGRQPEEDCQGVVHKDRQDGDVLFQNGINYIVFKRNEKSKRDSNQHSLDVKMGKGHLLKKTARHQNLDCSTLFGR
jgi:hypothetical protein